MAIKFNHKGEILALRDGFPKYCEAHNIGAKIEWGKGFAENAFRDAYALGMRDNEKLFLLTEIIIGTKSIPITFIENATGALTIEVNGKTIYTIKPKGRVSQSLIIAFTNSIAEELG
jgi:hypothetical protein